MAVTCMSSSFSVILVVRLANRTTLHPQLSPFIGLSLSWGSRALGCVVTLSLATIFILSSVDTPVIARGWASSSSVILLAIVHMVL